MAGAHIGVRAHKVNSSSGLLTGTGFKTTSFARLLGFSLRNTSATHSVVVILYAAKSKTTPTTTVPIAEIALGKATATAPTVNDTTTKWFGPQGVLVPNGIYVKITGSGTPVGSVFVG